MSRVGASVALAALVVWAVFVLAGMALSPPLAAGLAVLAAVASVTVFRNSVPVAGAIAVLAPFGVMLPALAIRHVAVTLGIPVPGFSTIELFVFLVAYVAFLCTAFNILPFDLYRQGFAPWSVAGMVLLVCIYALVTGNWFLAGVAVFGQLAWVMGWGSSNWFDMMLHVLLVPIAAVALILRVV
ncbi:MAG: hypothetical protein AAFW87_10050 [Pseudomonadota bacterium]